MRPFKKIFALSLGIIVFFFVAKVFISALFLAALISIPYLFFRGLKSALTDGRSRGYYNQRDLPNWQERDEPLFYSDNYRGRKRYDRVPDYRFIDVH